jgi:peptide deformylase
MIMPIVSYGNPVLKARAMEVPQGHSDLRALVEHMLQTMRAANGVGLAAPQVNHSLQLFVTDVFNDQEGAEDGNVFINPEILSYSGLRKVEIEGCLSIPGLQVSVVRPEHIHIRYQNLQFEWLEHSYSGMPARVIQHEYDHLQGILMTDRINEDRQRSIKPFLRQIARGEVKTKYELAQ